MQIGEGLWDIADVFDSVVGEYESGEFVEEGEVIKFSDLVVAQVNAFKEVESSAHVLNEG